MLENEYDHEITAAREWLGLDDEAPVTLGEYAWMLVQFLTVSITVAGIPFGVALFFGKI